tara:strand:+ start:3229 stop:5076 length:1848 start_codon:yes stop_codon:yes gene_type:complete
VTDTEYDLKAHYDKQEYMVPMRDGIHLCTAVYTPKDSTSEYPFLFLRTPYSIKHYGEEYPEFSKMAPSFEFVKQGYIFVFQDIRGTYKSEGKFVVQRPIRNDKFDTFAIDESTDNFDTIDWLLDNISGHNGKVGQWGISYSGWTTVMGMIDPHPALAASSPQASPSDMFIGDDWHHNGAFRLMYTFSWMASTAQDRSVTTTKAVQAFDYGTPWGYEFFLNAGRTDQLNEKYFDGKISSWSDFVEHPDYDDFWQRQVALRHLENITHPILNVAAWFDSEDFYGPLSIFQTIERTTPDNQSSIVIGPWSHGGWASTDGASLGDIKFGSKTSLFYQDNFVFPFFEYHLKGKGNWNPAKATAFETGNNVWRNFDQWPPKDLEMKNLFFHKNGLLSFDIPDENSKIEFDDYIDNPNNPVPFSTSIVNKAGDIWMVEDQRLASIRPDVLTFQSNILEQDITIAGPILASLFVSASGTDADYFVKLIDVLPTSNDGPETVESNEIDTTQVEMAGYQMLLGVEVMRAKYRNSMSHPEPLIPGKITPITFNIWDKLHTFKRGHRIMVQVHSSWFPAYDRNPHRFMNIYQAEGPDYLTCKHKIFRSSEFPSHIKLPVLGAASSTR